MQTQNMYELAEHLKQLREEKKNAEQRLKEMNAEIEQAKARIHRVSQTENCLHIYLIAKHTVDTKILRALRDKADLAKMLVDDYRNGSNPFQEGV